MIKKIILISYLSLLFSCGKKGDPEYEEENEMSFSNQ